MAGYLWLLAGWLIFGTSLPDRNTDGTYTHLWSAGDAVGPIGIAIAVSIAAYLIGTLIQAAVKYPIYRLWGVWRRLVFYLGDVFPKLRPWSPLGTEQWAELLAELPDEDADHFPVSGLLPLLELGLFPGVWFSDEDLRAAYRDLVERELAPSRRRVAGAVSRAEERYGDRAVISEKSEDGARFVEIPMADEPESLEVPQLSLGDPSLIQSRLVEVAEKSGLKIEQMLTEASFRDAIALPLVALVAVFATQVSYLWILGLAIPVALLWQGREIRRAGTRELIDALRARAGSKDLEQITPIFAQWRDQADAIAKAIRKAAWGRTPPPPETPPEEAPKRRARRDRAPVKL